MAAAESIDHFDQEMHNLVSSAIRQYALPRRRSGNEQDAAEWVFQPDMRVTAQVLGMREPMDGQFNISVSGSSGNQVARGALHPPAGEESAMFTFSPGAALGLACATCSALCCLLGACLVGPPLFAVMYCWAWVTWLSHWTASCDQPLDAWLGAYLIFTAAQACCSRLLLGLVCCWRQSSQTDLADQPDDLREPSRVKVFRAIAPAFLFAWLVLGRLLLARSKTCQLTSPVLHTFLGRFSLAFLLLHLGQLVVLGLLYSGVPLILFLARREPLHSFAVWLADHGLLQTTVTANPDLINHMEAVEYKPDLFADPNVQADPRPQGECCICLQAYDASKVIRRTPCGHLMHHECLSLWLRTAATCPACRGNLQALPETGLPV